MLSARRVNAHPMTEGSPTDRRAVRAVLLVGILVGLGWVAVTTRTDPAQVGIASDVYYHAGRALLAGGDVYGVAPPDHPGYTFLYPPVVALAFVPHAVLGSEFGALALQTPGNVAAAGVVVVAVVRALERRDVTFERADVALLAAFALLGVHALPLVVMGQVTLPMAAAMAWGFDALERGRARRAGVALAGAALVKLFPAAVGAWLLRRGENRTVAAAVATGLMGLTAGAVLLGPDLTVTYALTVLPTEVGTTGGDLTPDPRYATVRRQFAALGVAPALRAPLGAAALAVPVAALYRDVDGDVRATAALLGTLAATMLFLSLEPLYFPVLWFPLLVLLYRLPPGRARGTLLAGTLGSYLLVDIGTVALAAPLLPAGVGPAVLAAARGLFTVVQPPSLGLWLLLIGSVLAHREGTTDGVAQVA
jgi:hypothetical protein